jgi:hypothetical protein
MSDVRPHTLLPLMDAVPAFVTEGPAIPVMFTKEP